MKIIERILIKLTVIQLVCLLLSQVFFHRLNILPELKQITQYEGVSGQSYAEVLETIQNSQ